LVVDGEDNRQSAVRAAEVTERIHLVDTQRKPNIPRLVAKLQELCIEMLPLLAISEES
jgi:hypothetical protein